MTQIFNDENKAIPVSVVEAGPCVVTQIKNEKKDNYFAIQVGYGENKKNSKALKGHLKKSKSNCRYLNEFRDKKNVGKEAELKVKDIIGVEIFDKGDIVKIAGMGKGKGFQGVVKRHGFAGSPASHGHKDQLRMPGSIGATGPAHVFKGKRMAGRMGGKRVTALNLEIVDVDEKNNLLYIKGAVPGAINGLLIIAGKGEIEKIRKQPIDDDEKKNENAKQSVVDEVKDLKDEVNEKKDDKKTMSEDSKDIEEKKEEIKKEGKEDKKN